jgi:hypothetical protein
MLCVTTEKLLAVKVCGEEQKVIKSEVQALSVTEVGGTDFRSSEDGT